MPAVRTTATSKATRRTSSSIGTQASSRPLRRGSSPLLPHRESQRSRQAARIHVPGDDYEEEFGKYIPNAAFERWERKRDQLATNVARKVAPALRCVVAINARPLREFCLARQNFEDTCGIPFKLHPHILDDLRKKVNELLVYNNLRVVTQGGSRPHGEDGWTGGGNCESVTLGFWVTLRRRVPLRWATTNEVWREEICRYITKAIKSTCEEGPSAEVPIKSFYNRY
ncbi:hypothetical protein B0H13DRAFT_1874449 [Mycena leptocephala]|nr:hypothetical protein B0H13DRAFT_1874449 [Mycena leptocephala]